MTQSESSAEEELAPRLSRPGGAWLRELGTVRDGLLVIAAGVYGVGYFTWAWVAVREGLGALPALDLQYFVAGTPPLVFAGGAAICLWIARILAANALKRWPGLRSFRQRAIVMAATGALLLGIVIASRFPHDLNSRSIYFLASGIVVSVATVFLREIVMAGRGVANYPGIWLLGQSAVLVARALMLTTVALFGVLYVVWIYPSIPQAFGGARPRCAHLDVDAAKFSPDTLHSFGVSFPDPEEVSTVQLPSVDVLFAGHEVLIVRPRLFSGPPTQKQPHVIELPRDSVRAIQWCD